MRHSAADKSCYTGGMIQLIISDIDSTLIARDGTLPPENGLALREAARRGVRVALCTIRKRDSALQIADRLGVQCTLACNGGATIFDEHGTVLHERTIPLDLARDIAALADQHELPLLATVDEYNLYRPGSHPAAHIQARGEDVPAMLPALIRPPSRLIVRGEAGAALLMREFASAPLRFVRHYHADGTLADATITHIDATKESALAFLCAAWGFSAANVLAIGDAEADVGMLRMAGVGVAVGDGQADARAAADWVAPPADAGGVAAAVRRFCLDDMAL